MCRFARKGVSEPSIKFVYGAAVGQLHADIAAAVRPGEASRNGRTSIKPTVRQYKPLGGREHTRPSSARFIALIYMLCWWIPHKWPIRKAELKLHPQCHSSLSRLVHQQKGHHMLLGFRVWKQLFQNVIFKFPILGFPDLSTTGEIRVRKYQAGFKLESPANKPYNVRRYFFKQYTFVYY